MQSIKKEIMLTFVDVSTIRGLLKTLKMQAQSYRGNTRKSYITQYTRKVVR